MLFHKRVHTFHLQESTIENLCNVIWILTCYWKESRTKFNKTALLKWRHLLAVIFLKHEIGGICNNLLVNYETVYSYRLSNQFYYKLKVISFFFQNKIGYLRSTPLRNDYFYYFAYYLTLNILFATILPIGMLFFFSFSTLRGLNSIRNYFKSSSVALRCSTKNPRNKIIKQNHSSQSIQMTRNVIASFKENSSEGAPMSTQTSMALGKHEKLYLILLYVG